MNFVLKILFWVIQRFFKVFVFLFVVLAIGFGWQHIYSKMPEIGNVEKLKELADTEAQIDLQIDNFRRDIEDLKAKKPSWFSPIDRWRHNSKIKIREKGAEALEDLKSGAYEERLKLSQNTSTLACFLYDFVQYAKENYLKVLSVIFVLILSPFILKASLFILAGKLYRAQPLKLTPVNQKVINDTIIGKQDNKLEVEVQKDRPLLVRQGYLAGHDPRGCKKETKWFFKKRYPIVSIAAGLWMLTRVYLKNDQSKSSVVIITTEDPDTQIAEIKLENHPGMVIRPAAVAGISGPIKLRSKWVFNNLTSYITGQIRYFIFYGTGSIYVKGFKGIEANQPGSEIFSIDQDKLVGFDSRRNFKASRTETFFAYSGGKEALVECSFSGEYNMLYELASFEIDKDGVTSFFNSVIGATGKFFGF